MVEYTGTCLHKQGKGLKPMKDMLFIYNAHSGKGMVRENLSDIIDTFVKAGYRVIAYPTQKKLDAREYVIQHAKDYEMIVCSGGDGTLNEVVSGGMELEECPMLGYIPAGSTNDFASSIYLPKDMKAAAKIAVKGSPIRVDVGRFNKKTFVYVVAFGVLADVSYGTPQELKNVLGHSAYILEGIKKLKSLRSYNMKIRHDNGTLEGDYVLGMVTNSTSVGGFKGITGKNVLLDDGLFEVTLVKKPKSPADLNLTMAAILGMDVKTDGVIRFKTRKIQFVSQEKVAWTLDGEYGGSMRKVCIANMNKGIRIMSGISRNNK